MIQELAKTVAHQARALGVPPCTAERLAHAVTDAVRRGFDLGGCEVYVQLTDRTDRTDRAARDAAVRAAFDGRNRDHVCASFGISRATFYRIISESGAGQGTGEETHP